MSGGDGKKAQKPRGAHSHAGSAGAAGRLARKHEALLSAAGAVGWEWEIHSGRVRLEGDLAERLGLDPEKPVDTIQDFMRHVHPEDRMLHQASLKQALVKGRGPYTSAFRFVRPDDGRTLFLEDRGEVGWERDYSTLRVSGFLFEITSRG